jgi:hypothetical protein
MTCNFFRLALPDVINFFALSTTHRNMILFRDTISIEIFLSFQIASASDNKDYLLFCSRNLNGVKLERLSSEFFSPWSNICEQSKSCLFTKSSSLAAA